jgi:hypothetical protein
MQKRKCFSRHSANFSPNTLCEKGDRGFNVEWHGEIVDVVLFIFCFEFELNFPISTMTSRSPPSRSPPMSPRDLLTQSSPPTTSPPPPPTSSSTSLTSSAPIGLVVSVSYDLDAVAALPKPSTSPPPAAVMDSAKAATTGRARAATAMSPVKERPQVPVTAATTESHTKSKTLGGVGGAGGIFARLTGRRQVRKKKRIYFFFFVQSSS